MKTSEKYFFHLTSLECSALRTIAIIIIVLHNFAHKIPFAALENEFSYHLEHDIYFSNNIFTSNFLINLFSYWGHLGVSIFVFISGYGLSIKYSEKIKIKKKDFIISHYKKLFYPFLLGTITYIIIMYCFHKEVSFSIPRFILQCSMLLNLAYPHELYFSPGPYWYFGMTMQIYLIYIFIIHRRPILYIVSFTTISLTLMGLLHDYQNIIVWTKCNVIGWATPLCIGIIASKKISKYDIHYNHPVLFTIFMLSLIMLILSGKSYYLWLLAPIFVITIAISFVKMIPSRLWEKTKIIGNASLYLLIIHPIVRDITLPMYYIWGIWSFVAYIFISIFLSLTIYLSWKKYNNKLPMV